MHQQKGAGRREIIRKTMNKATSALDSENVANFVHSLHAKQARFMS
jgi:hypothetical protein